MSTKIRVETYFDPLHLTYSELRFIEIVTGLKGRLATDEFTLMMAEELVWPSEKNVRIYIRKLAKRYGKATGLRK